MSEHFDLESLAAAVELPERLTSIESWHRHMPFAFAIVQMLHPDVLVELGTHKGDSYSAFCQGVTSQKLPTKCFAVDTWQGDSQAGYYDDDVYAELLAWHEPRFARFSSLLRMTFDDALSYFDDGSVDLLHIDGLHTYEAVKHDYMSWLPKMSRRGVILFHDTNVRRDDFGVWKLWAELRDQYPAFEFPFSFGLGVLLVGDEVPEPVREFVTFANAHPDEVVRFFHRLGDAAEVFKLQRETRALIEQRESVGAQLMEAREFIGVRDYQLAQMDQRRHALAVQNEHLLGREQVLAEELRQLQRVADHWRDEAAAQAAIGQRIGWSRLWRWRNRLQRLLGKPEQVVEPRELTPKDFPRPAIDIIVPVYRGLEHTRRCIESVLASGMGVPAELIVINDASPEPELVAWLESQAHRFTLLHNTTNLGFVGTVNRGMRMHPWRDVVLLNSDTEVANDWLVRLADAAWMDGRTGSVTPFSNNATICSYPRFCEDNPLPPGIEVAELDRLCRGVNPGKRIAIPTAVGFCMYIRRDCLNEVGLFDETLFGKGYGEENEFCMRSGLRGWQHYLAADVFVFHQGGVSFAETQCENQRLGHRALLSCFPNYDQVVQTHVGEDPAASLRFALDIALTQISSRPKVLMLNHCRGGGTTRHVRELVGKLGEQGLFWLLEPELEGESLALMRLDATGAECTRQIYKPEDFGQLLDVLRALNFAHVHYQHTVGLHAFCLSLPERLGVEYDVTLHDAYYICPQVTMTQADGRYCGEPDARGCDRCLARRPVPGASGIQAWRHDWARFLKGARRLFVPSEDLAERVGRYFPGLKVIVASHEPDLPVAEVKVRRPAVDEALTVVVLGALSVFKGPNILEACARDARARNLALDFHLLGYAYRDLEQRPDANLTVHGPYAEDDLPALLAGLKPHVIWFPGSCPETYSYTLSAALREGYPVLAPRIGSFPERLSGRSWSWLVAVDRAVDEINAHWLEVRRALIEDEPVAAPAGSPHTNQFCYARSYFEVSHVPAAAAAAHQAWDQGEDYDAVG